MSDIEIIDRHGRRRRAKRGEVLADGERFTLPMQFMDAAAREVADHLAGKYGAFSDNAIRVIDSHGLPAGHRPGFLFDSNRALIDVADQAYEKMRERLADAWRKGRPPREDADEPPSATTRTLDDLRAAADQAYEDRNRRMADAWRTHHVT